MLKQIGAFIKSFVLPIASKVGGIWGWVIRLIAPFLIDKIAEKGDEIIDDYRREKQSEQVSQAIDEAIKTGDQRPIEEALGSSNAGAPTRNRDGVQERASRNQD